MHALFVSVTLAAGLRPGLRERPKYEGYTASSPLAASRFAQIVRTGKMEQWGREGRRKKGRKWNGEERADQRI